MENGSAATTAWRWAATAPPCGCRPASTEGACNKTVDPAPGMGRKRTGAYGGVRSRKILEQLSARRTRGQISSCIIAPAPASAGLAGRSPAPRIQPSAHGALLKRTVHAHLVGRSAAQKHRAQGRPPCAVGAYSGTRTHGDGGTRGVGRQFGEQRVVLRREVAEVIEAPLGSDIANREVRRTGRHQGPAYAVKP